MANEHDNEGYSFTSILADVKGSAFIEGEMKTPSTLLEAEAERILREAALLAGGTPAGSQSSAPPKAEPSIVEQPKVNIYESESSNYEAPESDADELTEEYSKITYDEPDFPDASDIPMITTTSENSETPRPMFAEDLPAVDIPVDEEFEAVARASEARRIMFNQAIVADDEDFGREPEEDELFEEPRLKDQAIKFARSCNSISRRLLPATLITVIMVLITFVYEADMLVPYGIGDSLERAAGTLVVLLLIVMMLCVEIIIRGVNSLIDGKPNAETLILFSCAFSILSATFTIISGSALMLPFCAVSALSLLIASYGERSNLRAMTDTLKTVISSAEPYGVQAEFNENLENTVLKKTYSRTEGFYTNMIQQDISEVLYQFATPILLIASLVISCIYVIIDGGVENSLHILSALLAAAAPFSALITYSLPFGIISKAASKMGVAIAGWGGADDIAHTDGACVTDEDMFPEGTLRLSGVKVFDGAPQNNVLCYTGSLIIASGSGLASLFAEVLKEKNIIPMRVTDFECHESGISAVVQGHKVATGSAAHMNLIGVRVPDDSNLRNAVFTAVNGRLVAMFTIDYHPLPAVQKALISMIKWRIDLYFAMRDFNITPSMVGQKFKVPFESFVFMPVQDTYSISDPYSEKEGQMAAVLVRESLDPYAEAITGARLLRTSAYFASILSVISAGLGMLLTFIMMWSGSFTSATPGNLMIYGFCMLAAVFVICAYVKVRK